MEDWRASCVSELCNHVHGSEQYFKYCLHVYALSNLDHWQAQGCRVIRECSIAYQWVESPRPADSSVSCTCLDHLRSPKLGECEKPASSSPRLAASGSHTRVRCCRVEMPLAAVADACSEARWDRLPSDSESLVTAWLPPKEYCSADDEAMLPHVAVIRAGTCTPNRCSSCNLMNAFLRSLIDVLWEQACPAQIRTISKCWHAQTML